MSYNTLQTISQVIIALGLLLTAIGGYGAFYFSQKVDNLTKAKTAMIGTLIPNPKLIFSTEDKISTEFEIGNSGAILTHVSDNPLFTIGGGNKLKIWNGAAGILVSVRLYDKRGNLSVELINNEWKVNPKNTWDRNYTKNALEVKDETGDIVLQIILKGNRVCFQGKIYDSFGKGFGVAEAPPEVGKGGVIYQSADEFANFTIIPIFKYPSDSYFGVYIDKL